MPAKLILIVIASISVRPVPHAVAVLVSPDHTAPPLAERVLTVSKESGDVVNDCDLSAAIHVIAPYFPLSIRSIRTSSIEIIFPDNKPQADL